MSYQFQGQLKDEEILLVTRRHPLVLLPALLQSTGILLIPFVVYIFIPFGMTFADILLLCLILAAYRTFIAWHAWQNTVLLLTNRRVLILAQKNIANREVDESGLEHVHRVTHRVSGLLPTLFNYGTLTVYTDDTQTAVIMRDIAQPFEIQQAIQRAMAGETEDNEEEESEDELEDQD